jgi:hypothetical protein
MVRMGVSLDDVLEGGVNHLTGEGVAGAGGRVAGASKAWVRLKTGGGRFGGTRKCNVSSLIVRN